MGKHGTRHYSKTYSKCTSLQCTVLTVNPYVHNALIPVVGDVWRECTVLTVNPYVHNACLFLNPSCGMCMERECTVLRVDTYICT